MYIKKFMNLKIISLSERIQIKKGPIVLFHLYKIIEKMNSSKVTANQQLSGGTRNQVIIIFY